ncbi:Omega-3 fatty acid receptor 1 [Tupaia chinensis]|uniref:Omega-3 fatty acid receptor 1 n=1 Tax=Tupaia chinensis TaxID=246437 RepID=L9KUV5_TUPCH|nr:Omega-3 fatty acid receptor 1 [Tupaia chinensis]
MSLECAQAAGAGPLRGLERANRTRFPFFSDVKGDHRLGITKASRKRLTVSLAYSESHQLRVSQQDFRLFRTLFLLMVSFFIMWSPIIITILLILIQNFKQDLVLWPSLFFWVVAFTFANSALNPILYNMSLFRNEWRKIFCCCLFPEKGAIFTDTSVRRNDLSIISS